MSGKVQPYQSSLFFLYPGSCSTAAVVNGRIGCVKEEGVWVVLRVMESNLTQIAFTSLILIIFVPSVLIPQYQRTSSQMYV